MATYKCSLNFCKKPKISGFGVFKIPCDLVIRQKWLSFIQKVSNEDVDLNKSYKLCENHFSPELILRNEEKIMLVRNSVPSIGFKHSVFKLKSLSLIVLSFKLV